MAKYTLKRNASVNYFNSSNGKNETKTFKKGDVIEGVYIPGIGGTGVAYMPTMVRTTLNGTMPQQNGISGEVLINIPFVDIEDESGVVTTANKNSGHKSTLAEYVFGDNSDMFATGTVKSTLFGVVVGTIIGFAYKHPIKGALIGLGAGILTYPILSKIPKN
tara:strand:+ start:22042 stop:22527 length:486 start_codon:yes stop_codon:yes gene_type:complete